MAEAKSKKSKKKDAPVVPLPTLEEALEWEGLPVDDWSGGTLGKVTGIHVDANDREPKWVIVKMGLLSGEAAIPFEHVAEGPGRIWAAYERDAVRRSPKMKSTQDLNARQELQLCEHYGIGITIGRAAEVADRTADEISAVPAL